MTFVDALFICISAATGTGLVTVDLSSLTAWQQVILVILEFVGNPVCCQVDLCRIGDSYRYVRSHPGLRRMGRSDRQKVKADL